MSANRRATLRALGARFLRFLAVGGFATILMYALLVIGVELLGWSPVASSVMGYGLSSIANYWLNHRLTFRSQQRHRVASLRFAVVAGCGLGLNALIMYVGTEVWSGQHYLWVQILATIAVLFWNFIGSQLWTFRSPPRS